jgi:hypothetical protein
LKVISSSDDDSLDRQLEDELDLSLPSSLYPSTDSAFCKHLTFLVYHSERLKRLIGDDSAMLPEISKACDALECLYRASSEVVNASFRRMGKEMVHLLINLIDQEISTRFSAVDTEKDACFTANMEDEEEEEMFKETSEDQANTTSGDVVSTRVIAATPEGDVLLRKATKILGHFARVGEATKTLAHFPGLLGCFIRLISVRPCDCIPWESRLSTLWTLANLACNNENMQMMVCTQGLVGALVDIACRPLHPGDSLEHIMEVLRSRSIASRAILNLSWCPENKIILSEHNALIDLLAELSVHRSFPLHKSRTVREIVTNTRRHAMGALRNLAAAPRRTKIRLCEYKGGHLLDVLTDAAIHDDDAAVKDRSFAAIHNLAIQDTAERIVNHPALVLALRNVLLADCSEVNNYTTNNSYEYEEDLDTDDGSPKSHASATLLVLKRTITPDMDAYESLRDLLEAVNPTNTSDDAGGEGGEEEAMETAAV